MTWPFEQSLPDDERVPAGELERLMHAMDWSATPVGPIGSWPHSLKSTVRTLLDCRLPMYLAWGSAYTQFYNDAYRSILGNKHPGALGNDVRSTWPEIWPTIGPMWEEVLQGRAVGFDDFTLRIERHGYPEDCYFNFSYSPVYDDSGTIAGVLVTFAETTKVVLAERRHAFQLKLSDALRTLSDPVDITSTASRLLGEHLGVGRAGYAEIDAQAQTIFVERDWTVEGMPSLAGEARALDSFGPNIIHELRAGRTLQLPDIAADPRSAPYAAGYESIDARSLLVVPLIKDSRLSAVLYLHQANPHVWRPEDIVLAEDVAERTWQALERARAESALHANLTVLEQVNQIGELVHAELRLEPLLQSATDAAVKVSNAQFGAFFYNTINELGDAYSLYTISGVPREAFSKFPMPRNTAIFAPTFGGTGIKRSADITKDPDYGKNAPRRGMPEGHLPVRSYLAVPVMSRNGEVFGGIFLGHAEPDRFTGEHAQMVQGIATQAAIGIINSRLYQSRELLLSAEREARSAAERESRLKEQFLNTLSHELRTPLNAIIGWTDILRLRKYGDAHEELAKALDVIHRNAVAQSTIINDLLDMSRITSGSIGLDRQEVELERIVNDSIDSVRPAANAKNIRIACTTATPPPSVWGDASRLQQVLWNLLTNAIKFTSDGGSITVCIMTAEDFVDVSVADSGRGIDPEFLPFVFERFRQEDGSVARKFGGLGLGLSIVKSLVELHGGRVSATSDGKDKGACFTVRLPSSHQHGPVKELVGIALQPTNSRMPADAAGVSGAKVLIVDDEPDALELMRAILENAGAHVTCVLSADDGLRSIAVSRPDILLSDIGMPVMDGYAFLRTIRELEKANRWQPMPAVAVTAFARPEDIGLATRAGFNLHLAKPIHAAKVIHTVAFLLASKACSAA